MLKFVPITPEYGERYMQFYAASEEKSADYTFANLWCWKDKYRYEMAFADDLCWLRHYENGRPVYNPPIGRWQRTDWEQILRRHFPRGFSFTRVPGMLACILSGFFEDSVCLKEERDHFEYIYSIPELIALNGYRFRNKRKLSNQFKQYYNYIYKNVSAELIPDIKEFQRHWLNQPEVKKDKEHKTILAENEAVNRMLDDWQHLPGHVFGGVLIIDNRIMAFALGERLDDNTIAVHFEKASYAYRGAYAAINRIMLENVGSNYRFVNREQDLGIEGLRKVKLEYNPVRFIKKYGVAAEY